MYRITAAALMVLVIGLLLLWPPPADRTAHDEACRAVGMYGVGGC